MGWVDVRRTQVGTPTAITGAVVNWEPVALLFYWDALRVGTGMVFAAIPASRMLGVPVDELEARSTGD